MIERYGPHTVASVRPDTGNAVPYRQVPDDDLPLTDNNGGALSHP